MIDNTTDGIQHEKKQLSIHTPPPTTQPSNVIVLQVRDIMIYLVGTSSVQVNALIEELRPYVVMVELCRSRRAILYGNHGLVTGDGTARGKMEGKMSLLSLAKKSFESSQSTRSAIVKLFLSHFTQRIAYHLQGIPGTEFVTGYRAGKSVGSKIVLGDRPIEITLLRLFDKLSLGKKCKLLWALFRYQDDGDDNDNDKEKEEKVDDKPDANSALRRDEDLINRFVQELGIKFPGMKSVLLDERDQYMADQLRECIRLTRKHFKRQKLLKRHETEDSSSSPKLFKALKRTLWNSPSQDEKHTAPLTPTKIVSVSMTEIPDGESPVKPLTFSTPTKSTDGDEDDSSPINRSKRRSSNGSGSSSTSERNVTQETKRKEKLPDNAEYDIPLQADHIFSDITSTERTAQSEKTDNEKEEQPEKKESTKTIVAVVGASHLQGIAHFLEHPDEINLDRIMTKPRINPIQSALAFAALVLFLVIILINAIVFISRGILAGGFDESLLDASVSNATVTETNSATNN